MRLFLAINLPKELKGQLFELGQLLKAIGDINTVKEENIHITLKFLGEAEPEKVINALESVKFMPFEVALKGVGAFPNASCARVIWAGCEKGSGEIAELHKMIEGALPQFERDRDFHPHATIARVISLSDPQGLIEFMSGNSITKFGSFDAKSFELMKSELSRDGPKYEAVKSFSLGYSKTQ